jgi:hypothetical protein
MKRWKQQVEGSLSNVPWRLFRGQETSARGWRRFVHVAIMIVIAKERPARWRVKWHPCGMGQLY